VSLCQEVQQEQQLSPSLTQRVVIIISVMIANNFAPDEADKSS
jgi:hypothetical protein